jgi:hypothetical protein
VLQEPLEPGLAPAYRDRLEVLAVRSHALVGRDLATGRALFISGSDPEQLLFADDRPRDQAASHTGDC